MDDYRGTTRSFISRLAAGFAAALLLTGGMTATAIAQDDDEEQENDRTFSSEIGQIVLEAQEALNSDNFAESVNQLTRALERGPSDYERGIILQMRGQAYYQMDQTMRAVSDWEQALRVPTVTAEERNQLTVNIGQIYIIEGRFQEGARLLEEWLRNNPPRENILMMLASAYAQNDQFREALPHAEQAFEMANPKERKHFDLLNYLYSSLNMPERQADIIRQMLNRWPEDKNLWNAWVSMLAEGGRGEEAFEVNKIMYVNGMLNTENDILRLVQYYSFYEVPYRGAQILEREINAGRVEQDQQNMELLINLWRQAREYDEAIPALEQAAAAAPDGELYEQLCEAYYSEAQYNEAETACRNALNKGGVDRPGDLWVLIGNSLYERDNRAAAKEAFQRGTQYGHSRSTANGWLQFIREEERAAEARVEFQETVKREECIITITRIRRDDVLGDSRGTTAIPEECEQYEKFVDLGG